MRHLPDGGGHSGPRLDHPVDAAVAGRGEVGDQPQELGDEKGVLVGGALGDCRQTPMVEQARQFAGRSRARVAVPLKLGAAEAHVQAAWVPDQRVTRTARSPSARSHVQN